MYQQELEKHINNDDSEEALLLIMSELGKILSNDREEFVYLLNNSGIDANVNMTDNELINLFINNIGENKKLLIGSSYLINHYNQTVGFDGQMEVDDNSVKQTYGVLYSNFVEAIAAGVGELAKVGQGVVGQTKGARKAQSQLARQQLIQTALDQKEKKAEGSRKIKKYVVIGLISLLAIGTIGFVVYKIKNKK